MINKESLDDNKNINFLIKKIKIYINDETVKYIILYKRVKKKKRRKKYLQRTCRFE